MTAVMIEGRRLVWGPGVPKVGKQQFDMPSCQQRPLGQPTAGSGAQQCRVPQCSAWRRGRGGRRKLLTVVVPAAAAAALLLLNPQSYASLAEQCWQPDAEVRPSFVQLVAALEGLLQQHEALQKEVDKANRRIGTW